MKLKPWDKLSEKEQNLYLTLLWEDGHSEQAIATFLSTTKGRIVRRRQTGLHLLTAGRPAPKARVDPERFANLLDLHDMEKLEEEGVSALMPPSPHEAPAIPEPEIPLCKWPLSSQARLKPVLCGKPVVPGHNLCEEHLELVRKSL
jgi:hypothetical protein